MKKIVSALIVAALFVCCMVPAAFAAENATVSVTSATAAAGDTVKLTLSVANAKCATYSMKLTWADELELVDIIWDEEEGEVIPGQAKLGIMVINEASGTITDASYKDKNLSGPICEIILKVKDGTVPGTYPVAIGGTLTMADSVTEVATTWVSGAVTVPCNEHVYGDWAETKAPTCTAAGEKSRSCVYCGAAETETIAALGHTFGEWTVTTAPACEVEGVETRTCSVCGETKTQAVAALGHTFGEWTVTTAPACEVEGVETATCSVCGETKTQAIAALEHQWGEWVTVKEAAIGVTGLMERTCSVCGEVQQQTIPALADPDLDDVPQTGDITMQLTAGIATVVVALFAGVAFVFKRKTAK